MGVYIDMEMPKKGEYRMTLYCDDGYAYVDVDLFPVDKDRFEAAPVPKHGRLIDADALGSFPYNMDFCDGGEADEWIRNAPTIIPASEEGEA